MATLIFPLPETGSARCGRRRPRCRVRVAAAALLAAALLAGCKESSPPAADPLSTTPPADTPAYPVSASIHDGSGQQTGWRAFLYSSNGSLARVVTYDAPGPDLQWETADDLVGYWSACSFAGTGFAPRELSIEYDNVPLEAAARAAWEALAPRELQCRLGIRRNDIFAEDVAEDIYTGAGPDLTWFTPDDAPDVYRYTANQGLMPANSFAWIPTGAAGSARYRQFWYTPDPTSPIKVRESHAGGADFEAWFVWGLNLTTGSGYTLRDAGADNVLNNADDTLYLKLNWLYRIDGSTTWRYFDGAGNQTGYVREHRASTEINYRVESVTTATGAGADGVWETEDDVRTELRYRY